MKTVNVSILSEIKNRQVRPTLDEILDSIHTKKSEKIVVYLDDILTISCCLQRLAKQDNVNPFSRSLSTLGIEKQINDLDRKKSENIRKYYNEKITVLILQGKQLTKFRKDLHMFLNTDVYKMPDTYIGMVYKLPYFYDYDKVIDEIFGSSYYKNERITDLAEVKTRNLTFIKKVANIRKNSNAIEYWFTDSELNKVMFSLPSNNQLLGLLDQHLSDGKLNVSTKYHIRKKDAREFFVMDKWSFV